MMSGYVDLQVNGYAGVDFNAMRLTDNDLVKACQRIRNDGTEKFLATIITAPVDEMVAKIARLARWLADVPEESRVLAGIHVEGPFINPADGFVGAHPRAAVEPATVAAADRLVEAGEGWVRMVTLAPEVDSDARVTRHLTDSGVVVAAGHSDASRDQLRRAIDNGLRLFTHLGNGCPADLPRHDNVIQRVLSLSDELLVSFIADGHHVPVFALRNYLRCIPTENIVIVTDAISAAGLGPGTYELSGQTVEVDEHGAAWAACRTHYAGCASTFPQMIDVLKEGVGASDLDIQRWMTDNPKRLLSFLDAPRA